MAQTLTSSQFTPSRTLELRWENPAPRRWALGAGWTVLAAAATSTLVGWWPVGAALAAVAWVIRFFMPEPGPVERAPAVAPPAMGFPPEPHPLRAAYSSHLGTSHAGTAQRGREQRGRLRRLSADPWGPATAA